MEGSAGSTADKKRNKLGYHRTSVACVHCRRRKIRCLLAHGDPQGRCENCIRLKKECHFYPVDQQPPIDKKGRPVSKADIASADAVLATTPPILGPGTAVDQKDSYFQYATMTPTPDVSPFGPAAPMTGTPMSTYATDPLMAQDLGGCIQLNQAVPFQDTSLYNHPLPSVAMESTINSPHGNVGWTQGSVSSTALTTSPPMSSAQNPAMSLVSPPLQPTATYGSAHGEQVWNGHHGSAMALGDPTNTTNIRYPSQLAPSVSIEFKQQITAPAGVYSGSTSPQVQAMPASMPSSYTHQPAPVGYTFSSLPAGSGMVPSNQDQIMMNATLEQPVTGYYPTNQLQYNSLKQEEMVLLADQGNLLDPNLLQNMKKPG
ncbi:hypothetical protein VTO42DRAFT_7773 [Malbranchea cinnamomea]